MKFVKKYSAELIVGIIVVILLEALFDIYTVHMATDLPKSYRTQIMQVVDVDNDSNVTLEDYEGNLFVVVGDTYKIGECYSVLFDTNNTEDITDDIIINVTFGGIWYTPFQMTKAAASAYEIGYETCLNDNFCNVKRVVYETN